MRITRGKVVDGQVVVVGERLEEGASVTVLVTDELAFQLNPEEEQELLDSIAEADRGEWRDSEDVLRRIG